MTVCIVANMVKSLCLPLCMQLGMSELRIRDFEKANTMSVDHAGDDVPEH